MDFPGLLNEAVTLIGFPEMGHLDPFLSIAFSAETSCLNSMKAAPIPFPESWKVRTLIFLFPPKTLLGRERDKRDKRDERDER